MNATNTWRRQTQGSILVPVLLTSVLAVQSLLSGYQIWHDYWAAESDKARQDQIDKKLDQIFKAVSADAMSKPTDSESELLRSNAEHPNQQREEENAPSATSVKAATRSGSNSLKRQFERKSDPTGLLNARPKEATEPEERSVEP